MLTALALGLSAAAQSPAADYYHSCMDTARIARLGSRPLGPMLQRIAALRNPHQLATILGSLHSDGIYAAFAPAGVSAAPQPYVQTYAFREHVTRLFELLGYPPAAAANEAIAAIGIETTLPPPRSPAPRHFTLEQLQRAAPALDWVRYFIALGEPSAGGLVLADPARLQTLNGNILLTPLDTWKSYLRWRWLDATALLLSPPFVREQFSFYAHMLPGAHLAATPPRAQVCAAARAAFPAAAYLEVPIQKNDYFGDTLALRGWVARQAYTGKHP